MTATTMMSADAIIARCTGKPRPLRSPDRVGVHHSEFDENELECICAGQGGDVCRQDCPIHDPNICLADPAWVRRYNSHRAQQEKIVEKLGWT